LIICCVFATARRERGGAERVAGLSSVREVHLKGAPKNENVAGDSVFVQKNVKERVRERTNVNSSGSSCGDSGKLDITYQLQTQEGGGEKMFTQFSLILTSSRSG